MHVNASHKKCSNFVMAPFIFKRFSTLVSSLNFPQDSVKKQKLKIWPWTLCTFSHEPPHIIISITNVLALKLFVLMRPCWLKQLDCLHLLLWTSNNFVTKSLKLIVYHNNKIFGKWKMIWQKTAWMKPSEEERTCWTVQSLYGCRAFENFLTLYRWGACKVRTNSALIVCGPVV